MSSFLGSLPAFISSDENVTANVSSIGTDTINELADLMGFENQVHVQPILENVEYAKSLAYSTFSSIGCT